MKNIILFILISFALQLKAQENTGLIVFERHTYWINIMSKLPFMTQEDIDRDMLTWGKNQGKYGRKYELTFNPNKSVYTEKEEEANYGYSWKEDDYLLIRDYEEKKTKDLVTFLGKTFLIEDETPKYKWKILNEIKEIAGYLCMKAETVDPIKNTPVFAWFTNKISVSGGPEGYSGLPGMILALELNENDVTIEAISVDIKFSVDLPIPKKMKGKEIKRNAYDQKVSKYIVETIEGRKNPYWQVRY